MVPCALFCSSVGRCVYREVLTLAAEADAFEPHGPAVVESPRAEAAHDVCRHVMMTTLSIVKRNTSWRVAPHVVGRLLRKHEQEPMR